MFTREATTMAFVASRTRVPVPRMHCAFVHGDGAFIVMECVRGTLGCYFTQAVEYGTRQHIYAASAELCRAQSLVPPAIVVVSRQANAMLTASPCSDPDIWAGQDYTAASRRSSSWFRNHPLRKLSQPSIASVNPISANRVATRRRQPDRSEASAVGKSIPDDRLNLVLTHSLGT